MSEIKISSLRPTGTELFEDSETFIYDLKDDEMLVAVGGARGINVNATNIVIGTVNFITVISANGNTVNANSVGNQNTYAK